MPLRGGESVGQAYVRIYGDGSSMPGDIRRAIDSAEPSVREAGENHGKTYADAFESDATKRFETFFGDNKVMFRRINDNLTEELGRLELAEDFFDHSLAWKKFQKRLRDEFGEAGRVAGAEIEREFRDSADLERLPDTMTNVGVRIRRVQADILNHLHSEALRMNKAFDKALVEQDNRRNLALRKQEQDALRGIVSFKNAMTDVAAQIDKLERGERSIRRSRLEEMLETLRRLAPSIAETDHELLQFNEHIETNNRRLRDGHPLLRRWESSVIRIGDGMGRLFGKGSRNDFFNIFGSFVGMLVKFPGRVLFGIAEGVTALGRSMSEAFTEGGGGLAGTFDAFVKGFTGIAGVAAKAAAGVAAFAGFIAILGIVLGPVVAVLSGLVAILTALASSAIFAAIGALAGFAPLLFPVIGIIGGIILAINRFKDTAGPLAQLFDTLEVRAAKWIDLFGDAAFKNIDKFGKRIEQVSRGLNPLFEAAGQGFSRFLNQMTKGLDSPAFNRFIVQFTDFLPDAMKDLGTISANVFGGLGGLLRGAIPLSERLLDWLVKITDQFNNWANSRRGQREIKEFLDRAGDSAKSFGDFLEGAWGWLVQLVDKSKGEGDTLWERIGGQFQEWADFIITHPDAFEQWMKDADELATSIGHLVDGLIDLIDTLDSPRNRDIGNTLVAGIGDVLSILGDLITLVSSAQIVPLIVAELDAIMPWVEGIGSVFSAIGEGVWFIVGGEWVGALFRGIDRALRASAGAVSEALNSFFSGIGQAFSGGGGGLMVIRPNVDLSAVVEGMGRLVTRVTRGVSEAVSRFNGMAGRAASAAGDVAGRVLARFSPLPGRVLGIVNQVVARFGNVAERIGRAIGDLWGQISGKFLSIVTNLPKVIDAIVGLFRGLAGRIIAAVGPIVFHPSIDWPSFSPGGAAHGNTQPLGQDEQGATAGGDSQSQAFDPTGRFLSPAASVSGSRGLVDLSGWQIITPSKDPRIVAVEVVNELIARVV